MSLSGLKSSCQETGCFLRLQGMVQSLLFLVSGGCLHSLAWGLLLILPLLPSSGCLLFSVKSPSASLWKTILSLLYHHQSAFSKCAHDVERAYILLVFLSSEEAQLLHWQAGSHSAPGNETFSIRTLLPRLTQILLFYCLEQMSSVVGE